jgi:hypothetical protein
MRYFLIAGLLLVLSSAGAMMAGPVWCGDYGGSCSDRPEKPDGFCGPREHFDGGFPHGFGGDGCWGSWGWGPWGCGSFDLGQKRQERFETRYDDFVADYDAAKAEDSNFYDSELYQHMLDRFGRLVDRYDRFVSCEESFADHLDDCIDRINERIDDLKTLLEEGPPDDLPSRCADKFEERINRKLDMLSDRLDCLTEKKDTLAGNLEDYLAFQTDLKAYLDEITKAGQDTGETALMMASADWSSVDEDKAAAAAEEVLIGEGCAPVPSEGAASVPEPGLIAVVAGAVMGLLLGRSRRVAR